MRPEGALYRQSAWFFLLFLAAMLAAFWPSYFARLLDQPSYRFHLHGVALTLWGVLLVTQAQLVRTNRRALHKRLGKLSYVLAPAIVVITTSFVHYRIGRAVPPGLTALPATVTYFLALTLNSLVVFAIFYGLAMLRRHDPQRHARWMVCTVFPLFTPITDRLVGAHWPSLAGLVPRIEGTPVVPVVGFALADAILLALATWDWRSSRRADVFVPALVVLLAYHASVLTLHRVPAWNAFCAWFLGLPLS